MSCTAVAFRRHSSGIPEAHAVVEAQEQYPRGTAELVICPLAVCAILTPPHVHNEKQAYGLVAAALHRTDQVDDKLVPESLFLSGVL